MPSEIKMTQNLLSEICKQREISETEKDVNLAGDSRNPTDSHWRSRLEDKKNPSIHSSDIHSSLAYTWFSSRPQLKEVLLCVTY